MCDRKEPTPPPTDQRKPDPPPAPPTRRDGERVTAEDAAALRAITAEVDDQKLVRLLISYWQNDVDRADRTPRSIVYLHLGMLAGICERLLAENRPRSQQEIINRFTRD